MLPVGAVGRCGFDGAAGGDETFKAKHAGAFDEGVSRPLRFAEGAVEFEGFRQVVEEFRDDALRLRGADAIDELVESRPIEIRRIWLGVRPVNA